MLEYQDRLLTYKEVIAITGLARSTIFEKVRLNQFPAPVKLGPTPKSAVRFRQSDVNRYINNPAAFV